MSFSPPPALSSPTVNPYNQPAPVKKGASWFLVVLLVVILGFLGFFSWFMYSENQKLEDHVAAEISKAQQEIDELSEKNRQLNEIVANRSSFSKAYDDFKGALAAADGYFNTDDWLKQGNASFDIAMTEKVDPVKIVVEKEKLDSLTESIFADVDEYKRELTAKEKARSEGEGTVAREAMNAIDPSIKLTVVENACEREDVMACVTSFNPRNVQVTAQYSDANYDLWYSIMMHEYAHVYQFENYSDFTGSKTVKNLFNSDPELHADCMAESRIGEGYFSTYENSCTDEQLEAAAEAWDGKW